MTLKSFHFDHFENLLHISWIGKIEFKKKTNLYEHFLKLGKTATFEKKIDIFKKMKNSHMKNLHLE